MGWNTYARSKMPLKLVLTIVVAVAVNFGLVVGFQALTVYRYTSPLADLSVLGEMDETYKNCTQIDIAFADPNFYSQHPDYPEVFFLVETASGDFEVVTVARHFLFDRYRIVKNACVKLADDTEKVSLRCGTSFFTLDVSKKESTGQPDIQISSMSGLSGKHNGSMMIAIAALCFAELAAYCLLFKREEIQ